MNFHFERVITMGIFSAIFKSYSEKQIKKLLPLVDATEALADKFAEMSDSEMREYTDKLKGDLADGNAVLAALVAAQSKMDDDEVPEENRILFITPTHYNAVNAVDTTKSKEVLNSFAQVIKVPQSRFYTAISLKDGITGGEEAGGFAPADEGKAINFMVIHKPATLQYPKHTVNKVIAPEENQESDGYLFFYRAYGLTEVYENKRAGIYCHHKA